MKTNKNEKNKPKDKVHSGRSKEDSPNMKLALLIEKICSDEFSFEKEDTEEKEENPL